MRKLNNKDNTKLSVWSTSHFNEYLNKVNSGLKVKENPWWDNQVDLRKPNLPFQYTDEEIAEILQCKEDIIYFAEHYIYVLTGNNGYQLVTLRDYQKKMLRCYEKNRFSISLSSRQVGKCLINAKLNLFDLNYLKRKYIENLYYENSQNKSILEKIKFILYKTNRIKILKNISQLLIEKIETHEYKSLELDEEDISKKIIDTIDLSKKNIYVESEDGFHKITHIHKTQPYHIYTLKLENGLKLECADNHIIFCKDFEQKFVKDLAKNDLVMTKFGLSKVKCIEKSKHKVSMYDITVDESCFKLEEEKYKLIKIENNPLSEHGYYSNNILSHNTVIASVFIIWMTLFHAEKNVGILSNKFKTCQEITDKIKEMVSRLPFFLKPGILRYNTTDITWENGSRIIAQATTPRSFIGFTLHCLYVDEAAHIDSNIMKEFYENAIPTISSMPDSKIILTSTPNGFNLFYDLYKGSIEQSNINPYHSIRVDWWEVPGRDEKWKEDMIATVGSEDAFMTQYGNSFLASGGTLLSSQSLKQLQENRTNYVSYDIPILTEVKEDIDNFLKWNPKFDIEDLRNNDCRYIIGIDLAEGGGHDYTIGQILKFEPIDSKDFNKIINFENKKQFFRLRQIGLFRDNETNLETYAKIIYNLVMKIMNPDNVRIVLEWNTYGETFARLLTNVYGDYNEFDESVLLRFIHNQELDGVRKIGLKLNGENKPIFCHNLKTLISNNQIVVDEDNTVREFETFARYKETKTYKAVTGHDDTILALVDSTEFFNHPYIDVYIDDLLSVESNKELCDVIDKKIDEKFSPSETNIFSAGSHSNSDFIFKNNTYGIPHIVS